MTVPMTFNAADHGYVPILLTRRGERFALRDLRAAVKARMVPMFVVAPVPWDWDTEAPAKTLTDHVQPVASDLVRNWGTARAYLDTLFLPDDLVAGGHVLEVLVAAAAAEGLPLTPVTGPDRSPDHHAAVARLTAAAGSTGVCLRVTQADALNVVGPPSVQTWSVSGLLGTLGVAATDVDLVFDFADQVATPAAASTVLQALLGAFPFMSAWRSVTFAGTSIPASMAGVPTQAVTRIARGEWDTYVATLAASGLPRTPRFGDYGVQHPDINSDVNPRFMRIFSQLRYSVDDGWLIARGLELRVDGYGHVPDLMAALAAQPQFAGRALSKGDEWIDDCATGAGSSGSAEVWRRVGTNHHLVQVATQVAATFGLAAP